MISWSRSLYSALHLILTLDNPLTAQFNSCQSLSPVSIWANTLSTQLSSYPHIAWRSCHQHLLPCQQLSSFFISCHKIVHLVASNPCLYSADDLAGAATILTGHNPAGLCSGSREGTQIKGRRGIGAQLNTNLTGHQPQYMALQAVERNGDTDKFASDFLFFSSSWLLKMSTLLEYSSFG